jgi:hypothetical protein
LTRTRSFLSIHLITSNVGVDPSTRRAFVDLKQLSQGGTFGRRGASDAVAIRSFIISCMHFT